MKYKRILLKISGETFGSSDAIFDKKNIDKIAKIIIKLKDAKIELAIVIGGGNIWRYRDHKDFTIKRTHSDTIGMLATMINGSLLESVLESLGYKTEVFSPITSNNMIAKKYCEREVVKQLEKGKIVILSGGTGNPYFTTDSAASLRALELECDLIIKATKVDGIYDKDPTKHKDAKKIDKITFDDAIKKELNIMDLTAFTLCKENDIDIIVCELEEKNISDFLKNKDIGTIVKKSLLKSKKI